MLLGISPTTAIRTTHQRTTTTFRRRILILDVSAATSQYFYPALSLVSRCPTSEEAACSPEIQRSPVFSTE